METKIDREEKKRGSVICRNRKIPRERNSARGQLRKHATYCSGAYGEVRRNSRYLTKLQANSRKITRAVKLCETLNLSYCRRAYARTFINTSWNIRRRENTRRALRIVTIVRIRAYINALQHRPRGKIFGLRARADHLASTYR